LAGRKKENAREKIMKVATSLFAKKGFDAATVDEIARKAKVNKALIYYYFKNKDDLLAKIFDCFMEESLVRFHELFAKMESKEVFDSGGRVGEMMQILLGFMIENEELLKLMLMESIKGKKDPFLEIMKRQVGERLVELLDEARGKGITLDKEATQMWVTEFFTGSIPMMVYIIYRNRWAKFFNVDKEVLDGMFVNAFDETHIEHHRK
jgi:TetR/AcrR family transcriptional regulator